MKLNSEVGYAQGGIRDEAYEVAGGQTNVISFPSNVVPTCSRVARRTQRRWESFVLHTYSSLRVEGVSNKQVRQVKQARIWLEHERGGEGESQNTTMTSCDASIWVLAREVSNNGGCIIKSASVALYHLYNKYARNSSSLSECSHWMTMSMWSSRGNQIYKPETDPMRSVRQE